MVLKRDIKTIGLLAAALVCAFVLTALAGSAAQAQSHRHHKRKDACQVWGNKDPKDLKTPQARKAITCYLNKERSRHGLSKLDVTKQLNGAAQYHTKWMRKHHCFDHECPGERTLDSRLNHANYLTGHLTSWAYGENIAWGQKHLGTPKEMVNAWMHSAGHRANILNGRFRDLGIGFETGSPSNRKSDAGIYTTDFGFRAG